MADVKTEKEIHELFDATLVLKGIHAALELVAGIVLYFVSTENITRVTAFFLQGELKENSQDVVANYLLHAAQNFGGSSKLFATLYLLSHGIINGLLVVGLWREKIWAYPVSLIVIGGFTLYQLYMLIFGFSLWLVIITVLDIIILLLIWHEYAILRKRLKSVI